MTMTKNQSLYDSVGGAVALPIAVDLFHKRVLADERIVHYFETVKTASQRAKQKAFLAYAFGGPNNDAGKDMPKAHAHLNLGDSDFNGVMEILGVTLQEPGIPDDLCVEAAAIARSVKDEVLHR